ncbi:MAG TPA: hypothetical protein VMA72_21465, partial [Streptosporangiaceae bacterium]|nr:hypothetical protein [Streptosporangiaceae bacterium]
MTRPHKHPSADKLGNLVVGELRPRKAAKVQAHVAQCEQCARVCHQLDAIRAILASASRPPPMPDDVSARVSSAIRSEARQRLTVMPVADTGRQNVPVRPPGAGADEAWHLPGLSAAMTRLVVVAGAVAIAAGSSLAAGNVGAGVIRPSSSPLAGAAAPAQEMSLGPDVTYGQPGPLRTIRAAESTTNFVAAHLRAEVVSAVHSAEIREAMAAQPPGSTAAEPVSGVALLAAERPSARRLAGCIGLIAPGQIVLVIDVARYEGRPATVIVTAATVSSDAQAWVVGSSCSATTKDVLNHVV